ncbi:FAD-dependent monooxygenase [Actinokineospora enzanensis]|uniref:FAD-dependent monooxygenase n=1 Tax=Actinokineospora enzanensis TaxID=155975 RepID=UPI00035E949D|nr:FAD-dependent monooxygenase [Actinokineospora enzanensis]
MRSVLISGASVAGPTLAYWLARHGFAVTVVERAPGPRPGGQAIDIRGAALAVVERMGVLDQVSAAATRMRGMSFVDAAGAELMSTTEETMTGGLVGGPDIEILRDDLTEILYRPTVDDVDYHFDDSITALTDGPDGVRVEFERGAPETFDIVVGADGLHSRVRSLVFGEEAGFRRDLGVYVAVFTTDNHLGLDHWQTFHQTENNMVGVYSARDNTEARAMLGFESGPIDIDYRDPDAQRRLLADRFAGVGWETPALLKAMWSAPDFYFDSMSQIIMDGWTRGRVALVGDAGYCGSPMSGQGTSMALVGAYVLAGELSRTGDHATAFAEYERKLRPFVLKNQRLATDTPGERPSFEALQAAATGISLEDYAAGR